MCSYVEQKLSGMDGSPKCTNMVYGYQRITGCSEAVHNALPMIHLQLGSFMYKLTPEQYVDVQASSTEDESVCSFSIYGQKDARWVLGSPFLNDFYQVYDLDRNQIGLVPSNYSNPNTDSITVAQADNVDEKFTRIFIISFIVLCFLFAQITRSVAKTQIIKKIMKMDPEISP